MRRRILIIAREKRFLRAHADRQRHTDGGLNRQRLRYEKYGFGLWAAVLQTSGEIVGQAGLTLQPCEGETLLEIGYLLKRRFWGRGYAREAANACKEYAFERLGAEKVYSIIKVENPARPARRWR